MTIQLFRTRVVTVQAVQWTGENIAEIQTLIAPGSPLWVIGEKNVGIKIDTQGRGNYGLSHELQFAEQGDWVVKYPSGRVSISKAAQFEDFYEPVEARDPLAPLEEIPVPPAAPTATAAFPLGAPITTTHPRALADRQPETDTDGHTVSER